MSKSSEDSRPHEHSLSQGNLHIGLANQVIHKWENKHIDKTWPRIKYTERDALEVGEILRDLLKGKLTSEGFSYTDLPDDEELVHHSILLPDQIIKQGHATCLYYSLVYASVLDNLGIQPLLLFMFGHVMPGWKKTRTAAENVAY
jgi:hypothetical protein